MDGYFYSNCIGLSGWTRSSGGGSCCAIFSNLIHPSSTSACNYIEYCHPSVYFVTPAGKYNQLHVSLTATHFTAVGNGVVVMAYTDSTLQLNQAIYVSTVTKNFTGNFTTFRLVIDPNANNCDAVRFLKKFFRSHFFIIFSSPIFSFFHEIKCKTKGLYQAINNCLRTVVMLRYQSSE